MKTSEQRLPGIKFIGWVDGDRLKRCVFLDGIVGQPVAIMTEVHEIPFCDNPECSCQTKKENGGYTDTATLKFLTTGLQPFSREQNIAFVVTDINGSSWLIGAKEPPTATFDIEMRHGLPDGDGSGFFYEISHVSCKSMIPCII